MKATTILAIFGLAGMGAAQNSTLPVPPSVTPIPTSVVPRVSTSSVSTSRVRRSTSSSRITTSIAVSTATSSRVPITNSTSVAPSVITTVVNQFVTICVQPTTFYVGTVCYTATSSNQAVTVTNCPCTVQALCPTSNVAPTGIITGALATTTAPAAIATAGAITNAPNAVSSAGAAGATQYAAATSTKYVTAGSSKPTLMVGLMSFLMSLPLLAVLLL